MTPDRHLSEDRLLDFYLQQRGGEADPVRSAVVRAHLTDCERCTRHYHELSSFLDAVHAESDDTVDEQFPEARLGAQFDRIMRRIDHLGRPGQVISFPTARRARPADATGGLGLTRRYVAAAAVASLLIGFTAGRFVTRSEFAATGQMASVSQTVAPAPAAANTAPSATRASADESFGSLDLSEIDSVNDTEPVILQAYDALTPTVREVNITQPR